MNDKVETKKKKAIYKKWWFWVIIVFILVAVMANGSGNDEPNTATTDGGAAAPKNENTPAAEEQKEAENPPLATLNQEVSAGAFAFTANKVEFTKSVGNEYVNKKTENQYLVVKMTVKNNDNEARMLDDSMFMVKDANGIEYKPDSEAAIYANEESSFFLEEINPNLTKTGYVVFELPEGITGLTLHCDSGLGWSGGESVAIDLGV